LPRCYRTVEGALKLELAVPGWDAARIAELWFAGNEWGPVASSGEQDWTIEDSRLLLTMPLGDVPPASGAPLDGLLVVTEDTGDGAITQGFEISAAAASGAAADTGTAAAPVTLLLALGLAFAGGLLLNLMPCVLPVLSIKVLGLVGHGERGRRHGAAFLAGVITTFGALALLLVGLRAGGEALGWGFQLQEPIVIVVLMYLMLAIGLNLSGVFEMGARLMGIGQGAATQQGTGGAFATGVLAVVVASPCTAPFMGTALGFALTRPAVESLAVFLALGVGFALPVVLLSLFPGWLRLVPPPGAWMERLRNALAFPMYGAAAWLLWVLSQQVDAATLASALGGALLLAFALWWYGQPLRNRRRQVLTAALLGLAALGLAATATVAPPPGAAVADSQSWSTEKVREHRESGRPVLVNFTAAWCITCKVNEQVALSTDGVREALRRHDVAYLKGDWTRRDAAITAELQRHGRSGVPLYLLYPAGDGDPEILPQVLTEGLVVQAIENI
jgi:thiol:disulfide interchange protein